MIDDDESLGEASIIMVKWRLSQVSSLYVKNYYRGQILLDTMNNGLWCSGFDTTSFCFIEPQKYNVSKFNFLSLLVY